MDRSVAAKRGQVAATERGVTDKGEYDRLQEAFSDMAKEISAEDEFQFDDPTGSVPSTFTDGGGFEYKALPGGGYEIVKAPEGSGVQAGLRVTNPESAAFKSIASVAKGAGSLWKAKGAAAPKPKLKERPTAGPLGIKDAQETAEFALNPDQYEPDPMEMDEAVRKNKILAALDSTDQRLMVKESLAGKSGPELAAALDELEAWQSATPTPQHYLPTSEATPTPRSHYLPTSEATPTPRSHYLPTSEATPTPGESPTADYRQSATPEALAQSRLGESAAPPPRSHYLPTSEATPTPQHYLPTSEATPTPQHYLPTSEATPTPGESPPEDFDVGQYERSHPGESDAYGRGQAMQTAFRKEDVLGMIRNPENRMKAKAFLADKSGPGLLRALEAIEKALMKAGPAPTEDYRESKWDAERA